MSSHNPRRSDEDNLSLLKENNEDDEEKQEISNASRTEDRYHSPSRMHLIQRHACKEFCRAWLIFGGLFLLILLIAASGETMIRFSTEVPMYLRNHEAYIAQSSVDQAISQANSELFSEAEIVEERTYGEFELEILYKAQNGKSILDSNILNKIREFEEEIVAVNDYTDYCALNYDYVDDDGEAGICDRHVSVVNFFAQDWWTPVNYTVNMQALKDAGTVNQSANPSPTIPSEENFLLAIESMLFAYDDVDYVFADPQNPSFSSIANLDSNSHVFQEIVAYWQSYCAPTVECIGDGNVAETPFAYSLNGSNFSSPNYFWQVIDSNFGLQDDGSVTTHARAARSVFTFGIPLKKKDGSLYETEGDDYDKQEEKVGKFLFDSYQDKLEDAFGGVEVYWSHLDNGMGDQYVTYWLSVDGKLALGSFLFVLIYLSVMNKSFFLGLFGMLMVLANFIPAILLYRFIGGYTYFGTLNILAIFIILGIGADDIFVFLDTYRAMKVS